MCDPRLPARKAKLFREVCHIEDVTHTNFSAECLLSFLPLCFPPAVAAELISRLKRLLEKPSPLANEEILKRKDGGKKKQNKTKWKVSLW